MPSLNRVTLIGWVVREPEASKMPDETSISAFTIAVHEKKTNPTWEMVTFVKIRSFGRFADRCNRYLKKGVLVYIEGRLRIKKYQPKDKFGVVMEHQWNHTVEIYADKLQILSKTTQDQQTPTQRGFYGESGPAVSGRSHEEET